MNNYEKIAEIAKTDFLQWNQEDLIAKLHLEANNDYLYITFCGNPYRIDRKTAVTEQLKNGKPLYTGEFNEVMSIFDVLCFSKKDAVRAKKWVTVEALAKHVPGNSGNNSFFKEYEVFFDSHDKELTMYFKNRGFSSFQPADIGCIFPVFQGLPAVFQFYRGDEEFPPKIIFLWDANTLDFLHFETIFYIEIHWLSEVKKAISENER